MGESVTFTDAERAGVLLIDAHPDVLHSLTQLLRLEPFDLHSATCTAPPALLMPWPFSPANPSTW